MKKNYLLLAVVAIMMSIGTYSLINTKDASALMSLNGVEALAGAESDGSQNRYTPYLYSVDCCARWESYKDSQGVTHYTCVSWYKATAVSCVAGNGYCTASTPCSSIPY